MERYIIIYKNRPLSYWYWNNQCCGTIKDQIGFSINSFNIYETAQDAYDDIKIMLQDINWYKYDIQNKEVQKNIEAILNNLKVKQYK